MIDADTARELSASPVYRSADEQRAEQAILKAVQVGERTTTIGMCSKSPAVAVLEGLGYKVEALTEAKGMHQIFEIRW